MTAREHTNGKKTAMEAIADSIPLIMLLAAVGGMALTPLYIMANNNSDAVRELKVKLEAHTLLPSHPVMEARVSGIEMRLDGRITGIESSLNGDIRVTTDLAAAFQAEKSRNESKFVEVETQMDSMAQSLNIQFANNQRQMADFQNAFHELGVKMSVSPMAPFYFPNISNRNEKRGQ